MTKILFIGPAVYPVSRWTLGNSVLVVQDVSHPAAARPAIKVNRLAWCLMVVSFQFNL